MDFSQTPDSLSEPSSRPSSPSPLEEQDEISLIDILKFCRRQFWVVGGIMLAVTAIGVGTGLATAPQARRELLLHLTLPPEVRLNSQITSVASVVYDEIFEAGSLALATDFPQALAQQSSVTPVSVTLSKSTEVNAARLQMVLTSEDAAVLETVDQLALATLQQAADEVIEFQIDPEIARFDSLIQRTQAKIDLLESRLTTFESLPGGNSIDFSSFLKLQQQAQQQALIAQEFSRLADLELERNSLASLKTREEPQVNIQVLMSTQTQESASLLQRLVLSAIAGFMLGVFVALIVDQLPRLKAALSQLDD